MLNFMVLHTILFFITSISAIFTKITHPIFVYTFSIIACPLLWSARTYKYILKIIYIEFSFKLHKISQFSTDVNINTNIRPMLCLQFCSSSLPSLQSSLKSHTRSSSMQSPLSQVHSFGLQGPVG